MANVILGPQQKSGLDYVLEGAMPGIQQGLGLLTQHKMNQMMQQQQAIKTAPGLQALFPNLNQEQAQQLAQMPPELLQHSLKALGDQQKLQAFQKAFGSPIPNQGGQEIQPQMNQAPGLEQERLFEPGYLESKFTKQPLQQEQQQNKTIAPVESYKDKIAKINADAATETKKAEAWRAVDPHEARQMISDVESKRKAAVDFEQNELKREKGEESEKWKTTAKYRDEIVKLAENAKKSNATLDKMETLNREGKLTNPLYYSLLKKAGLDFSALMSPQSQEYQKLEQEFLRGAKDIFGSRVTQMEMQQFLKGIPNLSQTSAGKSRVSRNLKIMNEAAGIKEKIIDEITENGAKAPPYDLAAQVYKRSEAKLDKLYDEFIHGQAVSPEELNELTKLYPPSKYSGRGVALPSGGIAYSNGRAWSTEKPTKKV